MQTRRFDWRLNLKFTFRSTSGRFSAQHTFVDEDLFDEKQTTEIKVSLEKRWFCKGMDWFYLGKHFQMQRVKSASIKPRTALLKFRSQGGRSFQFQRWYSVVPDASLPPCFSSELPTYSQIHHCSMVASAPQNDRNEFRYASSSRDCKDSKWDCKGSVDRISY